MIAKAEDEKASAFAISKEDIDSVLQKGSGVADGKYRIYRQFQKGEDRQKNIEFLKNEYGIPKFSGCVDGSNWFKGNGQWQDRNYEPQAGDIIFFDWEGDGETDHVGIVEKCENGVVYTVEGNSGDACRQNQYTVGSSSIYGYGVPAY